MSLNMTINSVLLLGINTKNLTSLIAQIPNNDFSKMIASTFEDSKKRGENDGKNAIINYNRIYFKAS